MNARLLSYEDQLRSIRQDAEGLMAGLSDAQFNWPPAPGRWSMAGCFDHLNKSAADLFIPMIDEAIAGARARGLKSDGPFAYSAFERWCIRNNDAPAKMKFKAAKKFHPAPQLQIDQVRSAFLRWQDELDRRLREADGFDLQRAKAVWGLAAQLSLGGSFQMMLAHERRHIFQAREVRQHHEFPR